jgi:hypothetical protein
MKAAKRVSLLGIPMNALRVFANSYPEAAAHPAALKETAVSPRNSIASDAACLNLGLIVLRIERLTLPPTIPIHISLFKSSISALGQILDYSTKPSLG